MEKRAVEGIRQRLRILVCGSAQGTPRRKTPSFQTADVEGVAWHAADEETVPVGVPAATPKHVRPTVPPGYTPSNRSTAGFTPSSSKKPVVAAGGDEPEEAAAKVDDDDVSVVTFSAALVYKPPPKVASKSRKKGSKTPGECPAE